MPTALSPWWKPWRRRRHKVSPGSGEAASTHDESIGADTRADFDTDVTGNADTGIATTPEQHVRFVCWLLGEPQRSTAESAALAPPGAAVPRLLERIDAVIASETLRAALLPRTPHVVPQLMRTLRDEAYSSADVATRISKDVVLTTEVLRSAVAASKRNDDDGEIDLAWAVAAIGTQGLRRAIANVVLRPMFDAGGSTLSARAASRIWKDADRKARRCTALATQELLDPLDGYLVGLLHDTGWTALLRAIDNCEEVTVTARDLTHPAVVPELLRRRDTLFGALVQPWSLSPAINVVAAELAFKGLAAARSPLGIALRQADRAATLSAIAR